MKTTWLSPLACAALLGSTSLAQEPPSPPQPPRPPEPGPETRDPAQRPPLPPPPRDSRDGDRGPKNDPPPGERPDRHPFPPRDGDRRGPDSTFRGVPRGEDREGPGPQEPEMPKKPTPYLGVVTSPAPPALSAQLGLGEGFGLVVDDVLPESPAQTAGLQRYDVIKQLNDQQLLDPAQLAALVRSLGKDTEATLTILRKGQEQKLTIKVGEKLLPQRAPGDLRDTLKAWTFRGPNPPDPHDRIEGFRQPFESHGRSRDLPNQLKEMQEKLRQYQDSIRKYEEQVREWQQKREGEMPKLPPPPSFDLRSSKFDSPNPPPVIFRELRPGGNTQVAADWYDGSSRWDASRARVRLKDQQGEVELALKDGQRMLTARNAAGETVFSGAVDTPEQRDAVPEPFRGKLQALEIPPPGPFTQPLPPPPPGSEGDEFRAGNPREEGFRGSPDRERAKDVQ